MGWCPSYFSSSNQRLRLAQSRFEQHDTLLAKEEAEINLKLVALKEITPLIYENSHTESSSVGVNKQRLAKAVRYFGQLSTRLKKVQSSRGAIQSQRQAAGDMLNNTDDFRLHKDLQDVRKITGGADAAYTHDVQHEDTMTLYKDLRNDNRNAKRRTEKETLDLHRATEGLYQDVGGMGGEGAMDLLSFAGIARVPAHDKTVRLGGNTDPLLAVDPQKIPAAPGIRLQPPLEDLVQEKEEEHKHDTAKGTVYSEDSDEYLEQPIKLEEEKKESGWA
jgi:uncharacterized membrane protein